MKNSLKGLIAATFTPMFGDGSLNLAAIDALADHCQKTGIAGAFVAGTNGECHSLTVEERMKLAQRWSEARSRSDFKLVVHVGHNCIAEAVELARHARAIGADAVAALSPSYFKPAEVDALVESMAPIAAAADPLPFYYYDIPAMTGVRVPAVNFLEIAGRRIPNLAGMKWTNPDLITLQSAVLVEGGRYDFLWGVDEMLMFGASMGLQGAVGGTFPLAPSLYLKIFEQVGQSDLAGARQSQFRATCLLGVLSRYGYFRAVKATMGMLGIDVGPARPPVGRMIGPASEQLRADLERIGFFDWGGK